MSYDTGEERIIALAGRAYPDTICDIATMDLPGVFDELMRLGRELLAGRQDIELVVLSSIWYHSAALFDRETRPIGRLRTWADASCAETVARFCQTPGLAARIYERTGNPPHAAYALYKWLQLCRDRNMETKDVSAFMALPDYLFYRFTGKRMVSTMTASASGLLNIRNLKWDHDLMDMAGIASEQLSLIVEPEHTEPLLGEAARALGLTAGIPVLITGADGACNHIAVGGLRPGIMSMSVGTSGALRLSGPGPQLASGPEKNWCYYGAEGRWINGAATNGAGACLDWFVKTLCDNAITLKMLDDELTRRYDGPLEAPIFLPFQFGERCPGWDTGRRGGWQDLSPLNERCTLYYSVLEGVMFNLYQCYRLLLSSSAAPEHIILSGGIVRSPVWLQMAADIFGAPMELADVEHASILGAVQIGQKVLGNRKRLIDIEHGTTGVIYPKAPDAFSKRFERYLQWYERTKTQSIDR